jgi:hypothetical protein
MTFETVDELIDKKAFNVDINKYHCEPTPEAFEVFEAIAKALGKIGPVIWWIEINKVFTGTAYLFKSKEDFDKFQKINNSIKFKINIIS